MQMRVVIAVIFTGFAVVTTALPASAASFSPEKEAALRFIINSMDTDSSDSISTKVSRDERQSFLDLSSGNPANGNTLSLVLTFLSTNPELNYQKYAKALSDSLCSSDSLSPATIQKAIIVLNEIDSVTASSFLSEDLIQKSITETIGAQGIMTYVYGLNMLLCDSVHALDPGYALADSAADMLLASQLPDGGFALTGEKGDVDVTAMTLSALVPYYKTLHTCKDSLLKTGSDHNEMRLATIRSAIADGYRFLYKSQLPDGDFASGSTPTSESTSQAILAFCALLDSEYSSCCPELSDVRDTAASANDKALSGLVSYCNKDKGISHIKGSPSNYMATVQGYQALLSGEKYSSYGSPVVTAAISKIGITGILRIFLLFIFVVLIILNRKNKKSVLFLLILLLLLQGALFFLNIQTRTEYLAGGSTEASADAELIHVGISITRETIDQKPVLSETSIQIPAGSSVFDLLCKVCSQYDIQMEYDGNTAFGSVYVRGIDYLYEFDHGDLSGWMYSVNDIFPGVGAGEYVLNDGDRVSWQYTCLLGKDLGDTYDD